MAAPRALAERDHELSTAFGDEVGPREQRLDTLRGVFGRNRDVDAHPAPLVESALDQTRLLEHADEDAHVALRGCRRELVRVDRAG